MVKINSHTESRYRTGTVETGGLINSKAGKIRKPKCIQVMKCREEKI